LFIAVVYFMADLSIIVFMWRKHRDEFSWFKHFAVPGVGGVVMLFALYKTVIPLPTGVLRPMPFIFLAVIVVSIVTVLILKNRNPKLIESIGQSVFVDVEKVRPEAMIAEVNDRDVITD
jgi:hypothetical protein